jgi:hypothetical protein
MVSFKSIFIFTLCWLLFAKASFASAGTEGASFLDIPVGAGPAAMGSAYSSLATDAYAPIYNPAGLGFLDATEVAAQHLSYLQSMDYEFGSVGVPLSHGPQSKGLAASVQYLGSGDIVGTDQNNVSIGNFSAHYAAYTFAYGQQVIPKLSLGLSGKVIESKIADTSAHAYAGDLGALYEFQPRLHVGATVANIGNKLNFGGPGDSLPLAFHLAAAYQPFNQWKLSVEGVQPKDSRLNGRFGGEWSPIEALSLRVGYRTDTTQELSALAGFSTGVGIHVWNQEFAYAWLPYGDLGDTQYFSLLLHFGGQDEAKRNLIELQTIKKSKTARSFQSTDPEYEQMMQLLNETGPDRVSKSEQ